MSARTTLTAGQPAMLGLRLQHAAGWHTYWVNPGDSGLPTRVNWTLPHGFKTGEIAWPTPQRFTVDGLANFGYEGDVLLPVLLDVPADARPGSSVRVRASVKWLACHEECVPGAATLAIDLRVGSATAMSEPDAAFARARSTAPENGVWSSVARIVGDRIEVEVRGADLGDGERLDAFAEQPKLIANAPPQFSLRGGVPVLAFAKSEYFEAQPKALDLVVARPHARAIRVHAVFVAADLARPAPASPN
ncbi:MAG: protein-disulfide reductase DsbD domain-containing protein [Rudaea sp.]